MSVEKFKEILTKGPPSHIDGQAWERMKRASLFQALLDKKPDLVSALIEQPGFDVNAKFDCRCGGQCATCEGKSGLKSETPCLSEICMAQAGPLHVAISLSGSYHQLFLSLKILKTILSIPGLDVNAKGPGGSTPLMQTVFNGRLEWIELLVEVDGIDFDVDLEKVGTTGGISIMSRFNEKKRTKILKCLTDARSKRKLRQRESEGEKKKEVLVSKVGLGKGRNARKRKNKEKTDGRNDEKEACTGEQMRMEMSLLQREEDEEKLKLNFLLKKESGEVFSDLAEKVKVIGREKAKLEEEMKEIESALDALFKRKARIVKKQKDVETKFEAIEKEKTNFKQNVAEQVHECRAKISEIHQNQDCKKEQLGKGRRNKKDWRQKGL